MNKYLIIINAHAGNRNNKKSIKRIKVFFSEHYSDNEIHVTTSASNCEKLVRDHFDDRFSKLIVAGGDGTVYEAINGMNNFDKPIGIIPLGKGNDYVKNLDIGDNLDEQLNNTLRNDFVQVDLGVANDRYFLNGVGAGFDGQIVFNLHKGKHLFKGHLAYYFQVLKILGSFGEREIHFSIDDHEYKEKAILIIAGNGTTFGGGFKLLPKASVIDGQLSFCLIGPVKPLRRFLYLNKLKAGTHGSIPSVKFFQGKSLKIESGNVVSQIDGEVFEQPPLDISISQSKLKILAGLKCWKT